MGYSGFYNMDKTVYCPTQSKMYSNPDSLSCRRFKIIDASIKYNLTIADDRDTLLYNWLSNNNNNYQFITEGYVEKQNKIFENKKLIYIGRSIKYDDPIGMEQIEVRPSDVFVFDKIVILPKNYPNISICALLKTSHGKHISVPLTNIDETFILKSKIDKYVVKYGKYWVDLAIANKIKVGMPVELVIFSWGEPDHINKSSYGPDQWCYGNQYVYIENGKVTAWN